MDAIKQPPIIEGNWLYLIEDGAWNLKLGFSADLYRRLYQYRPTDRSRIKGFDKNFWVLGVRRGEKHEELEFHKTHKNESIAGGEWYPFKSRAGALLLLQPWEEPPMKNRVIWWGEGPHYNLVHRRTTSGIAMLWSIARKNKRGPEIVLHPCKYCGGKYSARSVRAHHGICKLRPPKLERPGAKGLVRNPAGRPKKQKADPEIKAPADESTPN